MKNIPRSSSYNSWLILLALLLLPPISTPLFAADERGDEWVFGGAIYLWGASVTAKTPGGRESEIPFYKILDNLEMAFMGGFGARNDKWSVITDIIYLDAKTGANKDFNLLPNRETSVSGDVRLKTWLVTPTVGYAVHDSPKARVEVVGGLRYLRHDEDASVFFDGVEKFNKSDSGSVWDGIVGMRAEINLSNKWYLPLYFDVGAGDSKSTWQGFAGVGYRFEKVSAILAYRYLDYDFDNSTVLGELTMNGPFAGIRFGFR